LQQGGGEEKDADVHGTVFAQPPREVRYQLPRLRRDGLSLFLNLLLVAENGVLQPGVCPCETHLKVLYIQLTL
jgi:hypothetical protein